MQLNLNGPQSRFWESVRRGHTSTAAFGRGVGKSWILRNAAWILVAQNYGLWRADALEPFRGIRIVGLMDTHKHFVDVHGAHLVREIEENWAFLGGKVNKTTLRVDFADGSWFQPFPAEQHSSKSARGLRCDVVVADEVDDIEPAVFDAVMRPWFTELWSLKIRLAGGTPRRGRRGLLYHLFRLGQSTAPEHARYSSIHATYRDAPETVDAQEVEDARANSPPAVFAREWECNFEAAAGLVFADVYDERFHVRTPPAAQFWSEMLIGGDFGFEDPGVLLLIGVIGSGRDAIAWVLDEIYERHQGTDWWIERLAQWMAEYPRARLYYDPSAKTRIEDFRKRAQARPQEVDNAIEEGIVTVASMFLRHKVGAEQQAHLYVHPRCRNVIWELGAYRRKGDTRDPGAFQETPEPGNDHAMDAMRYALHSRFGRMFTRSGRNYGRSIEARQ